MRPQDIQSKSDRRSINRASRQSITAKLYKVDGNKILYTVTSAERDKNYIVTIQLLDLTGNKLKSLKAALQGNIRISCTCPAFLYMGYKFITWHAGVGIDKETRSPDITNPNKEGMACKHILVALNQLKSDYQPIYNMFKSSMPKQDEVTNDVPNNDNEPNENDLEVIDKFNEACLKLYNDYTEFKKSDSDGSFADSDYYDKSDPSVILNDLSKAAEKLVSGKFIGRMRSLDNIINLIDQKKNGFTVLLKSDIQSLTNKLNSIIKTTTESIINNIVLSLMCS